MVKKLVINKAFLKKKSEGVVSHFLDASKANVSVVQLIDPDPKFMRYFKIAHCLMCLLTHYVWSSSKRVVLIVIILLES